MERKKQLSKDEIMSYVGELVGSGHVHVPGQELTAEQR
jgi:hypothetical protein